MSSLTNIRSTVKDLLIFLWQKILFRKPLSILMYHSVSETGQFFTVKPGEFAKQMRYLNDKRYNVLSFSEVLKYIENKNILPQKSVIITFDDGYKDNYDVVFPIIKKYNFPITVFLTTGLVGQSRALKGGGSLPILSETEIKEMSQSGLVSFQPHGHTHAKLWQMDDESVKKEISDSKKYLDDLLGISTEIYAYAWGKYNDRILSIVSGLFRCAVSVRSGFCSATDFIDNKFHLPRQAIDSKVNFFRFKLKI